MKKKITDQVILNGKSGHIIISASRKSGAYLELNHPDGGVVQLSVLQGVPSLMQFSLSDLFVEISVGIKDAGLQICSNSKIISLGVSTLGEFEKIVGEVDKS